MKQKLFSYSLILAFTLSLSSCATIFTSSKQEITISGESGTSIYDGYKKIGHLDKDGIGIIKVKKSLSSKKLTAKKEGYEKKIISVNTTINWVTLFNFFFTPGFLVDLATGQLCKYDDDYFEIEMEKTEDKQEE